MAMTKSRFMEWLATIPDEAELWVHEDGLSLCASGGPYYEIGGECLEDDDAEPGDEECDLCKRSGLAIYRTTCAGERVCGDAGCVARADELDESYVANTEPPIEADAEHSHDKYLAWILSTAQTHGEDSEPDHEVGDLQEALREAFVYLTEAEKRQVITNLREEHDWLAVLAISPEAIRCLASHHDMQVGGMDSMGYDEVAFHHEQRSAELGRYADRLVDAGRGELPVPDFRDGHIEA